MISQLNPNYYISQNDIYVRIGNPNLKSYRVNSYGMSLLMFNSIYLLGGYDSSKDGISSYMYADKDGIIYQTYTNDSKDRSVVASLNFNKMLFNMMAVDLSTYYTFSNSTVRENQLFQLLFLFITAINGPTKIILGWYEGILGFLLKN